VDYNSVPDNGSIFIRLATVAPQICEITRSAKKNRTFSSSWSSKVIDLDANRKLICNCPSVINSNFCYFGLSCTVFEIFTHKSRWFVHPTPPLLDIPLTRNPSEFLDETYPQKLEGKLYGESCMTQFMDWQT